MVAGRHGVHRRSKALKRSPAFLITSAVLLLALCGPAHPAPPNVHDNAFREGWAHLDHERFAEAGAAFARIPHREYDLGDYVLYFSGMAAARGKKRVEASEFMNLLEAQYPGSPLIPYMRHEIGYAAALDNDLRLARAALDVSRGRVSGGNRKSEEGFVAALLAEENGPNARAAQLHLDNFAAHSAQSAAALSYERLWGWWKEGLLASFDLPVGFYAKLGRAVARAGDAERARAVYDDALNRFPPSNEYYAMVLDYAEFLRKQGATAEATDLLAKRFEDGLAAFRSDVQYLQARVDWKAGKLAEARKGFLAVASGDPRYRNAERARYQAAWVLEDEGDVAGATAAFGELRLAADDRTRQEAIFRHAYGLYRLKRYDEAVAAFRAGERGGFGPVESARHRFWGARALKESGRAEEADRIFASLAADPLAGVYALLAVRERGGDPFRMLNSRSSGETEACRAERRRLWDKVLGAPWAPQDAEKVRRAERLTDLGAVNYAVLEAQRVDRGVVKRTIGLPDGGSAGLFRYLAGDLKGAIRETVNIPPDPGGPPGLIDRLQYPLAPEYVSDCDRPQSGIDPLVLHAIMRQESSFQADVLSSAGAVGLMQLMPGTAAETARREKLPKPGRADLTRPEINVRLGAAYLSRLLKEFDGDYFRAVAAYNGGESAVKRWWAASGGDPAAWLERISYQETRFYVRKVFLNLLQYYRIYRPAMFARYLPSAPTEAPKAPDAGPTPGTAGPAADVPPTSPTPEADPNGGPPPTDDA
jgi:soluble lytic murein transglycosylase